MEAGSLNLGFCAIIVASKTGGQGKSIVAILERSGIEYVFCGDIYQAVGYLAGNQQDGRVFFILGDFTELSREDMRLFDICRLNGRAWCCCIFEGKRLRISRAVTAAAKAGAFVVSDVNELERIIEKIQVKAGGGFVPELEMIKNSGAERLNADRIKLSQAELDALLKDD